MNKNPFEIRADVLAMAKDYLDKQVAIQANLLQQQLTINNWLSEETKRLFKVDYTMEELTKTAAEMYKFVCGDKQNKNN